MGKAGYPWLHLGPGAHRPCYPLPSLTSQPPSPPSSPPFLHLPSPLLPSPTPLALLRHPSAEPVLGHFIETSLLSREGQSIKHRERSAQVCCGITQGWWSNNSLAFLKHRWGTERASHRQLSPGRSSYQSRKLSSQWTCGGNTDIFYFCECVTEI